MTPQRPFLLLAFTVAVYSGVAAAGTCNGMGRRYCLNAHVVREECPKPCQLQNCADNQDSHPRRGGGWEGVEKPSWEEIALSGKYEFVYTDSDWLCLGSCWYRPEKSECKRWEYGAGGRRYCKKISCEHDDRDRYAGCHSDSNGNRKLPWHQPTCKECLHVFPMACGSQLTKHVEAEDARKAEKARLAAAREMEMAAREVCYDHYFGAIHSYVSEADSSSDRRRDLLSRRRQSDDDSESNDDSSEKTDSGSEADDSSAVTSSEDDREEREVVVEDVNGFIMRQAIRKVSSGEWSCPPPQCLTTSLKLLQHFSAPSPPPPAPPSPPPAPWYHSTPEEGFCNWDNCRTGPQGSEWCRATASNCVEHCGGTWCPPPNAPRSWRPIAPNAFVPVVAMEVAPEVELEQPVAWVPPTEFNTSMCGRAPITDIRPEQAEGLSWEHTEEPFTANIGSVQPKDNGIVMLNTLSTAVNYAGAGDFSNDYVEFSDDYEDVMEGWDEFLAPKPESKGKAVAYIVLQLAETPVEVNQTGLLSAAAEMTHAELDNILVLDEPAITASDDPFSTVIFVIGADSPDEVVARMEAYDQETLSQILFRAGATYLPWSMTANVQDVSASLVSDMEVFESKNLSPAIIATIAACVLLVVAVIVLCIVRRKKANGEEGLPTRNDVTVKDVAVSSQ